jgi:diguanylate cyclase (GGDEF)-like protein
MMSDALAGAVLDALPDATAVLDDAGSIVAVNHAWRMFVLDNGGRAGSSGVGVSYLDVCDRSAAAGCADAGLAAAGLRSVLAGETVHHELEYPCPSPSAHRWFLLRITPLAGPERGAVASHVNITRRKMAEEILAHQAAHDPLTGLANRDMFMRQLTRALTGRSGRGPGADIGVLYLDLDGFKQVNDTYGHDAGDEVLLTAANRLSAQVRPQDTVARLGGDEFAVTAPRITAGALAALAGRLTSAQAEPHLIHGHHVQVGATVGSYLASPGELAGDALRHADQAMYRLKRARPRH